MRHISRPCLDSKKSKKNGKKKSRNFEFGERPDFDVLKTHIIWVYLVLMYVTIQKNRLIPAFFS